MHVARTLAKVAFSIQVLWALLGVAASCQSLGLSAQQEPPPALGPPWTLTGNLTGIVFDEEKGPISGATVEIVELSLTTKTRPDGSFAFHELPVQPLSLHASAPGYYPSRRAIIKVSPEREIRVEIQLVRKEMLSETVVVTGTLTEHLQVEAPVRTAVVTSRDIQERKAAVNLADTLTATIAGVRVESTCQNCGVTAVRLNGLEGKYTQILEDGLPTVSSVSMVYALDQIPTEFVESIEVVKGGTSALYGPNAVGGVINLIRREPRADSLQFTTQTGWRRGRPVHTVGFTGQKEKLPGSLSADYYFRGLKDLHVDANDDGFSDLPKRRGLSGGATLYRYLREGRGRLSIGGNTLTDYRRGGDGLDLRPEQTWVTEMADTARSSGFVRWNHTTSASTFYSLAASYSYLERDTYYGAGFDPNAYGHTRNPLAAADARVGHQKGAHLLMAGLQFQREQVQDHIVAYNRHFDEIFRNTGFYLQDEIKLGHRAVIVAGSRADKSNTLGRWVFSPRGNVRIGLTDRWNLRFGLSSGFRAPVIFDEDLHVAAVGGEGFVIENAPDLREERSWSLTSSLDYVGPLRGRPFQAGVNFFWTRLRDVHVLAEVPSPGSYRKFLRCNALGSYLRGAEFDASWQIHPRTMLRAGGTLQLARYREPEPDFGSLRYFRTPSRYGFAAIDLSLPAGFDIYADAELSGSMLVPHYAGYVPEDRLESSPAFAVCNLKLARTFGPDGTSNGRRSLRFYVALDNLFNKFQTDLDRGPMRDAGYFYGPRCMRSFRLGMAVTF